MSVSEGRGSRGLASWWVRPPCDSGDRSHKKGQDLKSVVSGDLKEGIARCHLDFREWEEEGPGRMKK